MKTKFVPFAAALLTLCLACGCTKQPASVRTTSDNAAVADSTASYSVTETQTIAPSQTSEAKLYADYLTNGGYEEILSNYGNSESEYEAEACLADINEDGAPELLLKITDKSFMGVRGYSSETVLLGVRNGQVEQLGYAEYGGGSGGGDYIHIRYDTVSQKHVLEYEELARDGMFASTWALSYFDAAQYDTEKKQLGMDGAGYVSYRTAHELRSDTFYEEGVYAQDAKRILRENSHCKQEDGFVTSFTFDGDYISETEFDTLRDRFIEPTDPAFRMKPVTLQDPIPAD